MIKEIRKKTEHTTFNIRIDNSNRSLQALLVAREIDLAIVASPKELAGFSYENLFVDHYRFFTNPTASFFKKSWHKRPVDAEEFANLPLIMVPEGIMAGDKVIDRFLWEQRLSGKIVANVDSFETAKSLCVEALGVAVLPERVARDAVKRKQLTPLRIAKLPKEFGHVPLTACFHESTANRQLVQLVIKFSKV